MQHFHYSVAQLGLPLTRRQATMLFQRYYDRSTQANHQTNQEEAAEKTITLQDFVHGILGQDYDYDSQAQSIDQKKKKKTQIKTKLASSLTRFWTVEQIEMALQQKLEQRTSKNSDCFRQLYRIFHKTQGISPTDLRTGISKLGFPLTCEQAQELFCRYERAGADVIPSSGGIELSVVSRAISGHQAPVDHPTSENQAADPFSVKDPAPRRSPANWLDWEFQEVAEEVEPATTTLEHMVQTPVFEEPVTSHEPSHVALVACTNKPCPPQTPNNISEPGSNLPGGGMPAQSPTKRHRVLTQHRNTKSTGSWPSERSIEPKISVIQAPTRPTPRSSNNGSSPRKTRSANLDDPLNLLNNPTSGYHSPTRRQVLGSSPARVSMNLNQFDINQHLTRGNGSQPSKLDHIVKSLKSRRNHLSTVKKLVATSRSLNVNKSSRNTGTLTTVLIN